jgi:hypothetical protein
VTGRPIRALLAALAILSGVASADPLPTTREDFRLPGTQPLSLTTDISTPDTCAPCHSSYGSPSVEPLLNWKGSMMAQSGRDPLMWAALAVSNQLVPHSGETCLRCHLPKGWLEGRSTPEDGTAMTADDRQGVQCGLCHRLVDPVAHAGNPAEDAAILAGLSAPVPAPGAAMMVVDPLDRLRGPFDIVADLGSDPHAPQRSTLVSPFHTRGEICGTCHNLRNPLFAKNTMTGAWELTTMDTPTPDPTKGFPEQSTFDEWAASTYAQSGVYAPQFGGNQTVVSTCQDCHMPQVTGRDANFGVLRTDLPFHGFAGANTFIPTVLPFHPAFGAEVDPSALQAGVQRATDNLQKAATVTGSITGGTLTVRVTNETGHKLPTGYPEGRRMWLHVRALDAKRTVVFESGRYVFSSAHLVGDGAAPADPEYDPNLHVWEAQQGMSADVAAAVGLPAGRSFHLSLNNLRLKDNRIPPRGFTNAAFAAIDAEPVGGTFADGQYWDDVTYPVGPTAVTAEVTLYYQTASREYVEFLRDTNTTNAAGNILFSLYDDHGRSEPVSMSELLVDGDVKTVAKCRKQVSKLEAKYEKSYYREWAKCFGTEVRGVSCNTAAVQARLAADAAKVHDGLGGVKDATCAGRNLTPATLGHGGACPAPCASIVLAGMSDLASCAVCLGEALGGTALNAAYGTTPPTVPGTISSSQLSCQRSLDKAAGGLAGGWSTALARCEDGNASGKTQPPVDCTTDPGGRIAVAKAKATGQIARCAGFSGLSGCATSGNAAAVQTCVETAVGNVVGPYTEAGYP